MRKLFTLVILTMSTYHLQAQNLLTTPQFVRNLLQDNFEPKETIVATLLHESFLPDRFIQVNKIKHQETWLYQENKKGISDSTLLETIDYLYNDAGQMLQEERTDARNSSVYKYVYNYNTNGLVDKRTDYVKFRDQQVLKNYVNINEFTYNEAGLLTANISYDTNNVFIYSQLREFDANGNIVRLARNSGKNFSYISNVFHYNNENNLEKIDFMGPEKRVNYAYTLKTDTAADKKIISVCRDGNPFRDYKYNNIQQCVQRVKYDYNDDGPYVLITKIIYNSDGTVNTRLSYLNNELTAVQKVFYKRGL